MRRRGGGGKRERVKSFYILVAEFGWESKEGKYASKLQLLFSDEFDDWSDCFASLFLIR